MDSCIFCKIATGNIDGAKVFEDEQILGFLDTNPKTKGHTLIIPKQHFENIFDIDEDVLQKISITAKQISKKMRDSLHADGIRILQSNGSHAGQVVFHYHMHVIPYYQNDPLPMNNHEVLQPLKADFEELKKLAEEIKL